MAMRTTGTIWTSLKNEPMQNANPADLADHKIPSNTGFLYQLGGGQSWGLYFPNGGEIFVGGMYAADAQHPIEVWDDSVSGKSTASGRGGSQLEEKTFGIPGFVVGDVSAKGLLFHLAKGNTGQITVPITLSGMGAATSSGSTPFTSSGPPPPYQPPSKEKPKPGRNTAAAKIIAFGNWDVVPVYFAPKD